MFVMRAEVAKCTRVHYETVSGIVIYSGTLAESLGDQTDFEELSLCVPFLGKD